MTVKTRRPLLVVGSVVELAEEDVNDFIGSVDDAAEELGSDLFPWEDNFKLANQRRKNNHKEE